MDARHLGLGLCLLLPLPLTVSAGEYVLRFGADEVPVWRHGVARVVFDASTPASVLVETFQRLPRHAGCDDVMPVEPGRARISSKEAAPLLAELADLVVRGPLPSDYADLKMQDGDVILRTSVTRTEVQGLLEKVSSVLGAEWFERAERRRGRCSNYKKAALQASIDEVYAQGDPDQPGARLKREDYLRWMASQRSGKAKEWPPSSSADPAAGLNQLQSAPTHPAGRN